MGLQFGERARRGVVGGRAVGAGAGLLRFCPCLGELGDNRIVCICRSTHNGMCVSHPFLPAWRPSLSMEPGGHPCTTMAMEFVDRQAKEASPSVHEAF